MWHAIELGDLKVGAYAPSVRMLTEKYGVAGMTAKNALRKLHEWEVISVAQGRRSIVLRRPTGKPVVVEETVTERLQRIEVKLDRVLLYLEALERND